MKGDAQVPPRVGQRALLAAEEEGRRFIIVGSSHESEALSHLQAVVHDVLKKQEFTGVSRCFLLMERRSLATTFLHISHRISEVFLQKNTFIAAVLGWCVSGVLGMSPGGICACSSTQGSCEAAVPLLSPLQCCSRHTDLEYCPRSAAQLFFSFPLLACQKPPQDGRWLQCDKLGAN